MRGVVLRIAAVAAGAGCLFVGAAAGSGLAVGARQLALMPLPKPALGTDALTLPLDRDSGVVSNAEAAGNASGHVTAARLSRLGRITGYTLDYNDAAGHALDARRGLLEVQTEVELYRSPAAARAGLAFWRRDEANVAPLRAAGVVVSVSFFGSRGLGSASFAASGVAKIKGKPPIRGVDVQFVRGPLTGSVSVSAADPRSRRAFAVALARRLAARIDAVLHGRVTGPPVPLPGKAKAGPPPSGLDLSALALAPADLPGATLKHQGYRLDKDLDPLSEYVRLMALGRFAALQEEVAFFHSPTEAGLAYSVLAGALTSSKAAQLSDPSDHLSRYKPTRVAVTGGDEARAVRALVGLGGGRTVLEALVVIRVGATTEFLVLASPAGTPLPATIIQRLAALAARRAQAGLHR